MSGLAEEIIEVGSIRVTVTTMGGRRLCAGANTLASFAYYSIAIAYDATCM